MEHNGVIIFQEVIIDAVMAGAASCLVLLYAVVELQWGPIEGQLDAGALAQSFLWGGLFHASAVLKGFQEELVAEADLYVVEL